ncbi:hypothetical protein F5X68DRAFT_171524 [Plectosphaerella plurivora]|uniref:Smr domain-containing protein n=1 Tax=Plectosphaerella plurivora TaxID=936078 RepID=A0A9P9AB25_9PEZI|nr:hypothetical protein F5X68DRAFT_171524 [Plectosphaerella plurivora]
MADHDSKVDALVAEYSSLLDEALVIALVSDHNLDDPAQLAQARETLQTIAKDVPLEEATGFNPSGIADTISSGEGTQYKGTHTDDTNDKGADDTFESSSHGRDSESCHTGITSPNLEATESSAPRIRAFEGQTDEYQVSQLQEMFADLKTHDIELAFRKTQGNFQSTLEYLLNIQYLESTGERQKGVDTFFRPEGPAASRKKRRKKNKQLREPSSTAESSSSSTITPSSPASQKQNNNETEDILFVAEKLDLSFDEVSQVYRTTQSREATIVRFLERYLQEGVRVNDHAGKQMVKELARAYKSIPEHYLTPLVALVGDVGKYLDEVATLLNPYFASLPPQRLALDYKLAPLVGEEIEGFTAVETKRKPAAYSPLPLGVSTPKTPQSYTDALAKLNVAAAARSNSYASASSAYRKGGSNPLYRQAAAFYADQAKEQSYGVASARSAAADALVSSRAASDVIDLHGVEVLDGVRIAKERVWAWWQGLGEYRAQEARRGFTVITGLGRHSAGGVSRLRQSVAAALIEDGWKVSVETGRFKVTGRR